MNTITIRNLKKTTIKYRKNTRTKTTTASAYVYMFPVPEVIHCSIFEELMVQDDCTYIKFYYGIDRRGRMHFELVGVDSQDREITAGILKCSRRRKH